MALERAEAAFKRIFPKQNHLVMVTYAGFLGIFGLVKFLSPYPEPAKKIVKTEHVPAPAIVQSGEFQLPSEENLDQWLNNEKNIDGLVAYLNKLQ